MGSDGKLDAKEATAKDGGISLGLEIEKDSVTSDEHTTGLGAVFAGRSLIAAADDVADLLVHATNGSPLDVLVVTDGSMVADSELLSVLRLQIKALEQRLAAVGITPAYDDQPPPRTAIAAATGLVTLLGLLPSAVSAFSKITSRQYVTSGSVLADPGPGLDLRVAGAVRRKLGDSATATVSVDRFWGVPDSKVLGEVSSLVRALPALAARRAAATAEAAASATRLADATAGKAAAQVALQNLCDQPGDGEHWRHAWDHMTVAAATDLQDLFGQSGRDAATAAELSSLHDDLSGFVVSLLTAATGAPCALVRAMRAEWLAGDESRVLLHVRCVAGGVDQVVESKLGPDHRVILAGTSVEYAALGSSGLLFSGVFDNLWGGSARLVQLEGFKGGLIDYLPVSNATRVEPAQPPESP